MSLTLTELALDQFGYADISPLPSPPWQASAGSTESVLKVVSNLCEATTLVNGFFDDSGEYYNYGGGTPNDQYATAMLTPPMGPSSVAIGVRTANAGNTGAYLQNPGYFLIISGDSTWKLRKGVSAAILASGSLTLGASITVAAVGTTVYAFNGTTQLAAVTDTTYSSGMTFLGLAAGNALTDAQVTEFIMGSAALTPTHSISGGTTVPGATVSYSGTSSGSVTSDGSGNYSITGLANGTYTITPSATGATFNPSSQNVTVSGANVTGVNFTDGLITLPFLGAVTVVGGIPSGETDVFLGTVKVVGAAPSGAAVGQPGNPYLGKIRVLGSPPSGPPNISLGEVVIVGSKPAFIVEDVWLGSVIEG